MRILLAVALAMLLGSGASAQDWTLPRLSDAGLRDWERKLPASGTEPSLPAERP